MILLTDTHCHLDFDIFDDDREEVIDRAREAGIEKIIDPGIDIASSLAAVALADKYQEIYASIGIHPNSALSWNNHSINELEELATHPKVVAIGEIGLDYYRDRTPHQLQKDVFQRQLELASKLELPVIIHNRYASDDILFMIQMWCSNLQKNKNPLWRNPGVLHSFSDGEDIANRAIAKNFMIGITGPITFKNDKVIQKTVSCIPLDNILIETDAPFLTPHPYRGTRNEPARVRLVADKIALVQGFTIEAVAEKTSANAGRLFNWREKG